jgi:hypothetical protein
MRSRRWTEFKHRPTPREAVRSIAPAGIGVLTDRTRN